MCPLCTHEHVLPQLPPQNFVSLPDPPQVALHTCALCCPILLVYLDGSSTTCSKCTVSMTLEQSLSSSVPPAAASGKLTNDYSSFSGASSRLGTPQLVPSVASGFSSLPSCLILPAFSSPSWSPWRPLPSVPFLSVSPALYALFPGCSCRGGCLLAFTLLPRDSSPGVPLALFSLSPQSGVLYPPRVAPGAPVCDVRPRCFLDVSVRALFPLGCSCPRSAPPPRCSITRGGFSFVFHPRQPPTADRSFVSLPPCFVLHPPIHLLLFFRSCCSCQ